MARPIVKLIAAMARNRVIGKDGTMPWHYPEDLKRFKELTSGSTVVMGSRTYLALPKKPLPDRHNIVLTRSPEVLSKEQGISVYSSVDSLFEDIENKKLGLFDGSLWVIGGGQIYEAFMPYADEIYLTVIEEEVEGDVYFPQISDDDFRLGESLEGGTLTYKRYFRRT